MAELYSAPDLTKSNQIINKASDTLSSLFMINIRINLDNLTSLNAVVISKIRYKDLCG